MRSVAGASSAVSSLPAGWSAVSEPAGGAAWGAESRLARLGRLIDEEPAVDGAPEGMRGRLQRLCTVMTRVLPATGAGVSVLTEIRIEGGTAAAWGPDSRALEELQFSLGEGPCIEAFTSRRPVLEPDLPGRGMQRWPAYGPVAHAYGVRAVFAIPLQVGGARLGALDIYRDEPGSLSAVNLSQAVTFADLAVSVLLDAQNAADGDTVTGVNDVLPAGPRSTRRRGWSWSISA